MLGAISRFIPLLMLALAVVVGVIGRVKPEVFLKIPRYGYIPWALTGNRMPPYFDDACLYEENWAGQKGDVLISSGVKAGTFWIHNIVFLLRSQGRDDFKSLVDIFGSCELNRYPGHTLADRLEEDRQKRKVAEAEGFQGFQIFTAHHSPGHNPRQYGIDPEKNADVKYIAIVRNDREVLKSFMLFINSMTKEFRRMWGGFPPRLETPADVVNFMVGNAPKLYFGHLKSWWERKDLPNVLLLHYRNLRTNPEASIQQIAHFLEIPLSEDLLTTIKHKSSLEYMSHSSRADKYLFWLGYPDEEPFPHVYPQSHVRPGGGLLVSDSDTFLNDALAQKWEAAVQKEFGHDPDLIKFARHGIMPK